MYAIPIAVQRQSFTRNAKAFQMTRLACCVDSCTLPECIKLVSVTALPDKWAKKKRYPRAKLTPMSSGRSISIDGQNFQTSSDP